MNMEVKLKDTLNTAWKNDKTGFGFRMLQKMGWSEDKGLGKNETGITDNIKLSKREDGLGLGMEKNTDGAGNKGWNQTASSFNDVLALLKESYGKPSKKKKSKSDKSSEVPTITVGIKYKKHREAKDLSSKSTDDLKAILGAASTKKEPESDDSDDTDEKKKRKSKKDKKSKKKRKRETADSDESSNE